MKTVYRVDWRYESFKTGVVRSGTLPKAYKTQLNAEKAAQARRWITKPDGRTAIDEGSASVRAEGRP